MQKAATKAARFGAHFTPDYYFPRTAAILGLRNFPPSLFVFCAAKNKSDFRQIAEGSPKPLWILHLALYFVRLPIAVLY
jgi:hypothetical protein